MVFAFSFWCRQLGPYGVALEVTYVREDAIVRLII